MQFLTSKSITFLPALFGGAIFIFSALSLVVPSGYSYGSVLLVLFSSILIFVRNRIKLQRDDRIFIMVLFLYFIVHVILNIAFSLPGRSYDGLMRFLLIIPVYLLLINFPPKPIYFWLGLAIGTLGAGVIAITQRYLNGIERTGGYINPIQFGDVSLLMASLLLCGVVFAIYVYKNSYLASIFLLSSLFGFFASFLSLSRGGWLAIPLVLGVLFILLKPFAKKIFLILIPAVLLMLLATFFFLPQTSLIKQRIIETQIGLTDAVQGDVGGQNVAINSRIQMWENGWDAFKVRPLVGWGDISHIKSHFPAQWESLNAIDNFNHFHNEYLDALAKNGLVGFIVLMMLFGVPLIYFLNQMRTGNQATAIFSATGSVLIMCVMAFGLTQTFMAHISGVTVFAFYLVIIKAYSRNFNSATNT